MDAGDLDIVNRDPNDINAHIQVGFEDVMAEPEGVRSLDCVWKVSFMCFKFWKLACYNIATIVCGIWYSMYWGCLFAEVAFYHIWFITPFIKMLEINCGPIKKIFKLCLSCCLDPICESCGMIFHNFNRNNMQQSV